MTGRAKPTQNDPRMHSATDEDLMLQVRDGAGETLGVLFDRYQAPLFNFYCKLTGNRSLSEDLVQEVFLRILRYRQSYQAGTPFRAWIYQIARNARIDHFRKVRPQTELQPEMLPPVVPTDSAQERQQAAMLHNALMRLPEEKREVLLLSRFQELKCEEIARLVGCEVSTVRVRIHRALQELRQIFRQLERAPAQSGSAGGSARHIPPRRLGHEL
jgi:RNA polymerase sigma factor (sigma-70 family)